VVGWPLDNRVCASTNTGLFVHIFLIHAETVVLHVNFLQVQGPSKWLLFSPFSYFILDKGKVASPWFSPNSLHP
jgi:hypothetical protein